MSLTFTHDKDYPIAKVVSTNKQLNKQKLYVNFNVPKNERVRNISLNNGQFNVIPYINIASNQRYAGYVSGVAGSGKSSFASYLAGELRNIRETKERPVKQIVMMTTTDSLDPAFAHFVKPPQDNVEDPFIQINVNNPLFATTITIDALKDKILIFDDYDAVNKKLYVFIDMLLRQCLEHGRKAGIDVIVINHQTTNYFKTRHIIFECDSYVLFPSANMNSVKKFIKSYIDLSKEELQTVIDIDYKMFGFLYIHKSMPRYIITNNQILLI